jgi:hypothetical protein
LFGAAVLADLKAARDAHVKLKRGFHAVAQVFDARQIRAIFIAHRQVIKQVFHGCFRRIRLGRKRGERQSKLVRRRLTEARNAEAVKRDDRRVERDLEGLRHHAR